MPANVETAVYANTPAWHREGVVLDTNGKKGLTIEEALPASGLDWTVRKVPVYGFSEYVTELDESGKQITVPARTAHRIAIPGRYGVQRSSDNAVLGVVGKSWTPMQNIDGFRLLDDLIQDGEMFIEAAGSLDGGKQVWVLAHCPADLFIAGEKISQYILFTNGHDGRTAVTGAITPVRVECQNLLAFALRKASQRDGQNGRVIRVRHTRNASQRIEEAKHLLGLRDLYAEELARQGEWLVERTMSDGQFDRFLASLMPIKDETEDSPARTMTVNRRARISRYYHEARNLDPIRGTRWGALNAVVEYSDYGVDRENISTTMKAQTAIATNATTIKDRARELLTVGLK